MQCTQKENLKQKDIFLKIFVASYIISTIFIIEIHFTNLIYCKLDAVVFFF